MKTNLNRWLRSWRSASLTRLNCYWSGSTRGRRGLRLEQTRVLHPGRVLVFLRWQAPEASRM